MIEVYETRPEGFNCKVEAAGCYVLAGGKLLLLKNAVGDKEAGKWGVPGGKLEVGETAVEGMVRELFEETGIVVERARVVGVLYCRKPDVDYVFHLFQVRMERMGVRLSDEHDEYRWVDHLGGLPLMAGTREAYEKFVRRGKFSL